MRVIGVIDALGRVGPEVEHLVTHGVEVTDVYKRQARAAVESGVARRPVADWDAYAERLRTLAE